MSYVLDALRRADAERQRGALPGLQSQPQAPAAADAGPRSTTVFALMGAGAVGLLAIGAALAWWLLKAPDAPAPAATTTLPPAVLAPPAPVPPVPAPSAPNAAPVTPASPATATLPPEPIPMPEPVAKADTASPPKAAASAVAAAPPAASAATARMPAASAAAARVPAASAATTPPPATERLPTLAELPEALRRQIPTLQPGGAMDSPQPSARLLIVNGQPFREGDQLAPGLTLLQIRLRSAVLDFRGTRFELRY
ncbi:general secretion pathway protein GspB [Aquabacterium humicola]|uniref:general secretion pathway protein GspB n=1 Tax=Aquabacterium humicola TaxID=3237377 RepID=UPI00254322EB|nr:general secretion pathway protein GspB [Rubrivivax pictus]